MNHVAAMDVLFSVGCFQIVAAAPVIDLDRYTHTELLDIYQDTGVAVDALQSVRAAIAARVKTPIPATLQPEV